MHGLPGVLHHKEFSNMYKLHNLATAKKSHPLRNLIYPVKQHYIGTQVLKSSAAGSLGPGLEAIMSHR